MSRSTKKGFYVQPALMKKVEAMKDVKDKKIIQSGYQSPAGIGDMVYILPCIG